MSHALSVRLGRYDIEAPPYIKLFFMLFVRGRGKKSLVDIIAAADWSYGI